MDSPTPGADRVVVARAGRREVASADVEADMILHPIHDRVLVRPLDQPTTTASGLELVAARQPDQVGEVVAVGRQRHPEAQAAEELAVWLDAHDAPENAALVRRLIAPASAVHPGDWVIFDWDTGQRIVIDGERLLLFGEQDLLGVIVMGEV